MIISEIVKAVQAEPLYISDSTSMDADYSFAFASDLMSDALAMINSQNESTILITGLCNAQSLRTAEMLDIKVLLYVRNKKLDVSLLEIAKENGFSIFTTKYTMYETCGILYNKGLEGINVS